MADTAAGHSRRAIMSRNRQRFIQAAAAVITSGVLLASFVGQSAAAPEHESRGRGNSAQAESRGQGNHERGLVPVTGTSTSTPAPGTTTATSRVRGGGDKDDGKRLRDRTEDAHEDQDDE